MTDLFKAIATEAPPSNLPEQDHPLHPPDANGDKPIPTNKFYTNMLLENRNLPAFPMPYTVWMSKDKNFYGLAISQTRASQYVFGPENEDPARYYLNPSGIHSAVFSAKEFTEKDLKISLSSMSYLSTNVTVSSGDASLSSPLVCGVGLLTAKYNGKATPIIKSQVGFKSVKNGTSPGNGVEKYNLQLNDDTNWVMYVVLPEGEKINFKASGGNEIHADKQVDGVCVQIGSCPNEEEYDQCAGAWAVSASVDGKVDGDTGNYSIKYEATGKSKSGNLLLYAFPHQVASFTDDTKSKQLKSQLDSTTRGKMTAVAATELNMSESLPTIGFEPWNEDVPKFDPKKLDSVMDNLKKIAKGEADEDVKSQSELDSMYYSGKGLDKFALCLWVIKYVIKDDDLAKGLLKKLQDSFKTFVDNKQEHPLCYDKSWKGLVSTAGLKGDANADFGNSFYNDHHFHYGYFIHAAAIIAKVDKDFGGKWLDENKGYVNALLRDYANPSADDKYFPQFRSYDFWGGHSWAKGLFLSGDGKDEESSSEDFMSCYGQLLWGNVIGDESMQARARLMLAIEKRSFNMYFYYSDGNDVEPKKIVGNRVSGIFFENKVDHTTYFGMNEEYIHGIHMIPTTPASSFVRGAKYSEQEWNDKLKDLVDSLDSGWKGILKANQALFDAGAATKFFNDGNFDSKWLDQGQSHTWALANSAALQK